MRGPWRDTSSTAARVVTSAAVAATFLAYGLVPRLTPAMDGGRLGGFYLGVLLGAVVALGVRLSRRSWPWLAGAAAAGLLAGLRGDVGESPYVVVAILVVGAELWLLAWLLDRTGAWKLRDAADLLRYALTVVAVVVPAGLAVAALASSDGGVASEFTRMWRSWTVNDAAGLLCVAPAILTFAPVRRFRWKLAVEYGAYCAYTVVVSVALFVVASAESPGILGWPYLATLCAGVAAVRFGVRAAAPLAAAVTIIAVVGTAGGGGLFAASASATDESVVIAAMFGVLITAMILSVAVLRDARERALGSTADSLRLLQEVIDAAQSAVFVKDYNDGRGKGRYVLVNAAWEAANGRDRAGVLGHTDAELFDPDRVALYLERDDRVLSTGAPVRSDDTITNFAGQVVTFRTDKFALRDSTGRIWGVGGIAVDVTSVLGAQERESRQAALLRAVFELSPTPAARITVSDVVGYPLVAVNAAAVALGLQLRANAPSPDLLSYIHPLDVHQVVDLVESAAELSGPREVRSARREIRLVDPAGGERWVLISAAALHRPDVGEGEVIVQFEDVTARRAAEAALSDLALRDEVTGLPNRRALDDRLRTALARLARRPGVLAVMFCDIDRFKDVNDSLGHHAGDALLAAVARELGAALRPSDSIARLGGDEFVVIGEDLGEPQDAVAMAVRLQARLRAAWDDSSHAFRPTMSMGVAITTDPSMTAEELLRRADLAMYRAKEKGRDRIEVYEQGIDDAVQRAVAVQQHLRRAIIDDRLVLHYQPVVRLADRVVVGAEALVRLVGPDGALITPGEFIDQAETSGLIVPMGAWVVRRALADIDRLDQYAAGMYVAVNVSPTQLRDAGFADFLLSQLQAARVAPERVLVEVTETALLQDAARSAAELGALSAAGVSVALDDFGTGFSSLSWLTDFPVDVVKVDRSFTADVVHDERKAAVVRAITSASEAIGFSVVAEGIETVEQLECLAALGCHLGQGYLFGRAAALGEEPWTS